MKFKFLIVFLSLIICAQNIFAKDVGTTMFQILQMPTNAYDAALAETSISGETSSLSNPSLVPFAPRSITLSHVIFLEEMSYSIGDINFPFNERSAINFSFCYFDSGKMDRTIESGDSYITAGDFNATDKVFSLSYGQIFGKSFSAGASIKFIEQKILICVVFSRILILICVVFLLKKTRFASNHFIPIMKTISGLGQISGQLSLLTGQSIFGFSVEVRIVGFPFIFISNILEYFTKSCGNRIIDDTPSVLDYKNQMIMKCEYRMVVASAS